MGPMVESLESIVLHFPEHLHGHKRRPSTGYNTDSDKFRKYRRVMAAVVAGEFASHLAEVRARDLEKSEWMQVSMSSA